MVADVDDDHDDDVDDDDDSDDADSGDLSFSCSENEQWFALGWYIYLSFAFSWVGIFIVLQEFVPPAWRPTRPVDLATVIAFMVAPYVTVYFWRRYLYKIEFTNEILLHYPFGRVRSLKHQSVDAVVGFTGFNHDGGELLVWKRVVIITDNSRHSLAMGYRQSPKIFQALCERCPRAWRLPLGGDLAPPPRGGLADRESAAESLRHLRACYGRDVWNGVWVSGIAVAGCVAFGFLLAKRQQVQVDETGRAVAAMIVPFVYACVRSWRSVCQAKTCRVMRLLQRKLDETDPSSARETWH